MNKNKKSINYLRMGEKAVYFLKRILELNGFPSEKTRNCYSNLAGYITCNIGDGEQWMC